jgi:hypothetical protein
LLAAPVMGHHSCIAFDLLQQCARHSSSRSRVGDSCLAQDEAMTSSRQHAQQQCCLSPAALLQQLLPHEARGRPAVTAADAGAHTTRAGVNRPASCLRDCGGTHKPHHQRAEPHSQPAPLNPPHMHALTLHSTAPSTWCVRAGAAAARRAAAAARHGPLPPLVPAEH